MTPQPFHVAIPKFPADDLREIIRACPTGEDRQRIIEWVRIIEGRLRWLADEFGESRYPINKLGMLRQATVGQLGVYFAVDTDRRIVNVARFYRFPPRQR